MPSAKRKVASKPIPRRRAPEKAVATKQAAIQRIPTQELSLSERVEQVLIGGDLTALTAPERVEYVQKVCKSLGLNPLTRPFEYILFEEMGVKRLSLYARADAAAQLRKMYRISVVSVKRYQDGNMSYAEAEVRDGTGKTDSAIGVVALWKWKDSKQVNLIGRELANAIMKTETKAKRRATLSICGLAFLDEHELDTMRVIGGVTADGRIYEYQQPKLPAAEPEAEVDIEPGYASRLSPAQREIEEKLLREAEERKTKVSQAAESKAAVPPAESGAVDAGERQADGPAKMFAKFDRDKQTFKLTGPRPLLIKFKDTLLRKFWKGAEHGFIVPDVEAFAALGLELEKEHGILLAEDRGDAK